MMKHGFCTIATRSYLKYAVSLATSLQRYHPKIKLCVLLVDSLDDSRALEAPSIELFYLDDVRVANIEDMKVYFNAFELSNCLKPFFINHLIRIGFEKIVYLDADILVVNNFDDLFKMLDQYSFVLSPHWLRPGLVQNSDVTVSNIANLGIYNGGMWGIRGTNDSTLLLEWLMRFFPLFGFDDRQDGMFVDQKLLPLAAQLFSSQFGCIAHPGYNVGYWNLHEREITRIGNSYLVDGQPAVFFHLSGFRLDHPEIFSQHSSWNFERLPILREIIAEYRSFIPVDWTDQSGYSYDSFGDLKLTPELRKYYFIHRTLAGYQKARPKGRVRQWLSHLKELWH